MTTTRRAILSTLGAAGLALPVTAAHAQAATLDPRSTADQSQRFADMLGEAAASGDAIFLPPGRYRLADVALPDDTVIGGVPGRTVLVASGSGPILRTSDTARITLSGLTLDGEGRGGDDALFIVERCERLIAEGCELRGGRGYGIRASASGGRIAGNLLEDHGEAAIFSTDALGLDISHNRVRRCGNNGVLVWTTEPAEDGSRVTDNHISDIGAQRGGTGENGNGVNVFRAAGVTVAGNRITDCAFSAVRNNGGANAQIRGNSCERIGEVAIYAEFAFDGAVIADNIVADAAVGISITNMREGGRLAVCSGNLVRAIRDRSPTENRGVGISVEADASVTGNVVEGAPRMGLQLGFGPYLRDVTASGNTIRDAAIGIGVSVADGAGGALVTGNTLSGCTTPLAAMRWDEVAASSLDGAANIIHGLNRVA